ncbi:hypothetical protein [Corynebacterium oculi]|nr:hypothetical protein [Corynebacterium oculi]
MASLTCVPAVATAAEVAPGAPMRIYPVIEQDDPLAQAPQHMVTQYCTQGVPGTVTLPDGSQKNVMVTAAHCVWGTTAQPDESHPEIYVPLPEGDRVIGVREGGRQPFEAGEEATLEDVYHQVIDDDWATIALDEDAEMTRVADSVDQFGQSHGEPVVLTGVRDYPYLEQGQLSFDNLGQPICQDGQTSGRTCGVQLMRVGNRLWSVQAIDSGDSGGINYDPHTREALGVSTDGFGLLSITQAADVALEETYGIPDGQVNERFRLPESEQPHTPMRTMDADRQEALAWVEVNAPEYAPEPASEPPAAVEVAQANGQAAVEEIAQWGEQALNSVQDPASIPTVIDNARDSAAYLGDLAADTFFAFDEALREG